ncbi:hypothetical protein [Streptomyces sp.]|uniref:hypothetical protein n=1 Tax=Streptomyces sp. TaxID=1931 RepID=UPI002F949BC0
MADSQCYCDACSSIAEPPTGPQPCGFPNADQPGEFCGEYENHDGEHSNWARTVQAPDSSPSPS